jgi:hypothetical protein
MDEQKLRRILEEKVENGSQSVNAQYQLYMMRKMDQIADDVKNNSVEIGKLKVKAGVWGLIAGAFPIGLYIFIKAFFGV